VSERRIPIHLDWIVAVLRAQDNGDLALLGRLIRSPNVKMGIAECDLLAALLDRRRLVKKRGGQRRGPSQSSVESPLALAANVAEDKGDLALLAALLRSSNLAMSLAERDLLAALLERRRLGKKTGRPRRGLFRSSAESRLALARAHFTRLRKFHRWSRDSALNHVAAQPSYQIKNVETLDDYLHGRRGATRRRRRDRIIL
jgi:hypothetical protein